jgi:hypothetical protein
VKAFLRSPDDEHDGELVNVTPDMGRIHMYQRDFIRHDVRCGTANWIEFWEEGHTPPHHEEKDKGNDKGHR